MLPTAMAEPARSHRRGLAPIDDIAYPDHLPRRAEHTWDMLSLPTTIAAAPRFDPEAVEHLPAPVARWLRHTIEPGARLATGATLEMHGSIRISGWRRMRARQVISSAGYLWAADAGRFPLRVRGFDRYSDGSGEMQWRLLGLVPVLTAAGTDVTRSAAGRFAGELIGLTPGGALGPGVTWQEIDRERATATVTSGAFVHRVTIHVDDRGSLQALTLPRWGDPDQAAFAEHTFGVAFGRETELGPYTVPTRLSAGWWFGTPRWSEGDFFRASIDRASYR